MKSAKTDCSELDEQDLIVHAWEINGYVKINNSFGEELKQKILSEYNSFTNLAKKLSFTRKRLPAICNGEFTNTNKLFELTDFLGFEKSYAEKQIELYRDSKAGAYNRTYKNMFSLYVSPAIIRIVSHLIGDGSIYEDCATYSQVNVGFMVNLINKIIGYDCELNVIQRIVRNHPFQTISVPMIFIKIVCALFNIPYKEIASPVFLEKALRLPREHRVQILAALYVDEGNFGNKSIRMRDKKIVEAIARLMDSLGYERGEVMEKELIKDCFGKKYKVNMYHLQLYANGIKKFSEDIGCMVQRYDNKCLNLWQKQKSMELKVESHNYKKVEERKRAIKLRKKLLEILQERNVILFGEVMKELGMNRHQLYYLLKTLRLQNKVRRVSYGTYEQNSLSTHL